ncbi:hypothetical protein ACT4ZS_10335 [Acinetobacter baumannii]
MTDLNKEREAFERLPLAELAIKSEFVYYNEETNSYWPNEDFCPSDAPETMNFAWEAWQEKAKAQAVPENHIVVPRTREVVVAIEKIVQQQCDASGVQEPLHRLDGWRILEEIAEKVEEIK